MTASAPSLHLHPAPIPLDVPVIVFAFDRPDYLARALASLKRQRGVVVDERQVFLLQDDAVSPRSGVRYAEDAAIAASVATFREHFPGGHVAQARGNLGISRNIRRGEVLTFEALDSECGYFFEDDLELGPEYLRIMSQIRDLARADARVGYFAAYGDHYASPVGHEAWLQPLQHHWGFGLMREPWRRLRQWLAPYDAILESTDYAGRDHVRIFRWMGELSFASAASSQDSVKSIGCAALGIARLMTNMCFGRYIGARGQHFDDERFVKHAYDRMTWKEGPDYRLLPDLGKRVGEIIEDRRAGYERYRRTKYDAFMAELERTSFDGERIASEDEVGALYALLLDRALDESFLKQLAGRQTVRSLRQAIMTSREYRARNLGRP